MGPSFPPVVELPSLDEESCWRFLRRHHLGRVGFVVAAHPTILPVNYAVDGRSIVFRAAPGARLAAAARSQRVAFEVDEATEALESGTSVVVNGVLRRVTEPAERVRLDRLPLRTWAPGRRDELLRVEPTSISGRRIEPAVADGVGADGG